MKITQGEVVDRQTVLEIELEDQDLDQYLDRGYRRLVQRTVIPGFRKGKAPRRIVEGILGRESLLNEALDFMLPEVTSRAITERELAAGGLPQIELVSIKPLALKATVPLTPIVDPGPYREVRVEPESSEVTEEHIQERLERLRQSMGSWEPVERPAQLGDMVTMAVKGTAEGRTILDDSDAVFYLDKDGVHPSPDFAQNLVGLPAGEPKEFTVTVSENSADRSVAGKEAAFSVTISEVKARVVPDLDDEFAKSTGGGYESLDALRQKVTEELKTEREQQTAQQYRESVIDAILEKATLELPPLTVEHELAHMESERERVLERLKVRKDDYLKSLGKSEEEVREELREEALKRLNRTFVISEVGKLEAIKVSDEEVDGRLKGLSQEARQQLEREQGSEGLRGSVSRMLFVEKTMDRVCAIAKGEIPAGTNDAPAEE